MAAETMKTGVVDQCPDLEAIAAYLDRRLPDHARDEMAAHLASCETCYVIFTEAAQMRIAEARQGDASSSSWHRPVWPTRRMAWSAAGTLAVAASLILAVWIGIPAWRGPTAVDLQPLIAAVGADRPFEPRLSIGLQYAPLRAPLRAAEGPARRVAPDVRIAAANLEKELFTHRTAQALRALGVAYLVAGDTARAVPLLEEAVAQTPDDARLLSDLSAAYLVRAARPNQSPDLTRALAMADRAVKADHQLSEAWFNRAVALERLALVQEARDAWRDYLTVDSESGWAGEARQHLDNLQ